MTAEPTRAWRGPRWALAVMMACLGSLGPFTVDTYLPAFTGIAASLGATPVQMQQTLSAYLFGFAVMNLFHGALSDSVGRRPVVLGGLAVFTLASLGCALAESIGTLVAFRALQGMCAGAGMVVGRAIIRDLFPPEQAQKMMAQVTLYFGVAPAVAPIFGGWLYVHAGWHSIFWLLVALGALLWAGVVRWLPESLPPAQRQPFSAGHLLRGYVQLLRNARFVALVFASGVPFNGMFLYGLAAPAFLGEHLHLGPTQYFWFFVVNIAGIMGGAWWSGRLAGRMAPKRQIRRGFAIMVMATAVNLALNFSFVPDARWAFLPIATYAFGWSLMVPAVTLLALEQAPDRRGMASSIQASVGSAANAAVAGVVVPLVMHSTLALALASAALMLVGLLAWAWVRHRVG